MKCIATELADHSCEGLSNHFESFYNLVTWKFYEEVLKLLPVSSELTHTHNQKLLYNLCCTLYGMVCVVIRLDNLVSCHAYTLWDLTCLISSRSPPLLRSLFCAEREAGGHGKAFWASVGSANSKHVFFNFLSQFKLSFMLFCDENRFLASIDGAANDETRQ